MKTSEKEVEKSMRAFSGRVQWMTHHNCSRVRLGPDVKCVHFIRESMANGSMKIAHDWAVDHTVEEVRQHVKARYD